MPGQGVSVVYLKMIWLDQPRSCSRHGQSCPSYTLSALFLRVDNNDLVEAENTFYENDPTSLKLRYQTNLPGMLDRLRQTF